MPEFEVGDRVVSMPSKTECVITEINLKTAYPIIVHYLDGRYEGCYTLEGFRHKDISPESKKYFIAVNYPQNAELKTNNNYWSIVKVNSLFIHLSHAGQAGCIIPIGNIDKIYYNNASVILSANANNYDLGQIQFDEVADLLFNNKTNSI